MKFSAHIERWPAIRPFRITGNVWETFDSVVVEVSRDGKIGRGEALGVYYLDETMDLLMAQIEAIAGRIRAGIDRTELQGLLPAGGARNAIDCALWDLDAKCSGRSVWDLAAVTAKPLETVFTIGLEATPSEMAEKATAATSHSLLKVKLDADLPLERLRAIRAARPDARIVVDANQAWTFAELQRLAPPFAELRVQMIEQPLPRGGDAALEGFRSPVPLCADESCLHLGELEQAAARYQMINIKLDKTGGLTHALELARAARARGLGLMVGCMAGGSLAMAPTFVVGCLCDLVDIDGPLLQKADRLPGIDYAGGRVSVFGPEVWG
ncbi:MAG: N-acetyl-D-Glu racemase DgcA [Steroidobacteraceae bacterium]|jgi:L-alanine-DL-glutamate epimerase-like enolase superfamily enzyme